MTQNSSDKVFIPNVADAAVFLKLLAPKHDKHLFRLLDDKKDRKDPSLTGTIYDTLKKSLARLVSRQALGAGVFVRVNDAEGANCKKEDIRRVNAVWVDDDKPRNAPRTDWPIEPTIVVKSSPGKYHYYWMIEDPDAMSFDLFNGVMARLVADYGHDKNACKLTQIMRLPGFYHQKNEPFLSCIVAKSGKTYRTAAIMEFFPPPQPDPPTLAPAAASKTAEIRGRLPDPGWTFFKIKKAIDYIPQKYLDERHTWLRLAMALKHQFGEGGLALFDYLSTRSNFYDYFELYREWKTLGGQGIGKTTIGTLLHYARENPEFARVEKDIFEGANPESLSSEDFYNQLVFYEDIRFNGQNNWLIKGILGRGDISCVAGRSGVGKSFFVIDMALSVARGISFCGHKSSKAGVLYVVLEGQVNFFNRILAYRKENGSDDDPLFVVLPTSVNLHGSEVDAAKIVQTMRRLESEGKKIELVVIDTFAQAFAGGDENSSSDMGRVIKQVAKIRDETGAHVSLVHHHGKETIKGLRGHSSLTAAVDTIVELFEPKGAKEATLTKQKDGEDNQRFPFYLRSVELGADDDGDVVTSCVVQHISADSVCSILESLPIQTKQTYRLIEKEFLKVSPFSKTDGTKLSKKIFRDRFDETDISEGELPSKRKAFKRALDVLKGVELIDFDDENIWFHNDDQKQEVQLAA